MIHTTIRTAASLTLLGVTGLGAFAATAGSVSSGQDAAAPFQPTAQSLQAWETPKWFRDAKLGIFVHWGPYAVPAYGSEWYPRRMYQRLRTSPHGKVSDRPEPVFSHHADTWGPQSEFGYKDFVPKFKAERWDPAAWAQLFVDSGAKYVVPVAEHHDGFAMYDSSHTPWNAADRGPKRDVIGELGDACREAGLRFGVSSHYAYNWRYYTFEDGFDTADPANSALYGRRHEPQAAADEQFLRHWYDRTVEIIDKYQPEVLWFDFGMNYPEFEQVRTEVAAHYYNRAVERGQEVVLQYKENLHGTAFPAGAALLDIERGKLADIRELPWQTDTSVSVKGWGYLDGDIFKSSDSLIDDLVDIVSKNGCMLLNVGPRADGVIPEEAQRVLLDIGSWLRVNGEAIYGTRPWVTFGEGPTEVAAGHHTEGKNAAFTSDDLRLVELLGLAKDFDVVTPESGDALTASLSAAWRHRKPWLGYYWTPSGAVAEHPMRRLETGAAQLCDAGAGAETDPPRCRTPHLAPPRMVVFPESLNAAAPRISDLLKRFAVPHEALLDALAWRAEANASLDETAIYLLAKHPTLWKRWLDAPARGRFAEALSARRLQIAPNDGAPSALSYAAPSAATTQQ